MTKTTIVGYPRIGIHRELKFAVEKYFRKEISEEELQNTAKELRKSYLTTQKKGGINIIPSNDFSFYDNVLDTAFLLNIIPKRYKELKISKLDTYFAMARGHQEEGKDVKALPMKKWFNTNYHYIVPELEEDTNLSLNDYKPFKLYKEAKEMGIDTKSVIIGPFTMLKLTNNKANKNWTNEFIQVYKRVLEKYEENRISFLQIDEPILVTDLNRDEINLFISIYTELLKDRHNYKIILQTYFGDVRDIYEDIIKLNFDGYGLDFVEGIKNLELIKTYGYPKEKLLFAGVVNGKNIWKNNYEKTIQTFRELKEYVAEENLILSTSCSLLHVPYTVKSEMELKSEFKETLAFAEEKLYELSELKILVNDTKYKENKLYRLNQKVLNDKLINPLCFNKEVRDKVDNLKIEDFHRKKSFEDRRKIQKEELKLPILPTTTIGSFPQTAEVKNLRKAYKNGEINKEQYEGCIKEKIKRAIKFQEEIGLDVLVHGEYERNDMVEYFGKLLDGFIFTSNGWVQSYGTRGVKPPIIFGDVKRSRELSISWISYAQSLTKKYVKGMLTGPITILNWSFPREDLDLKHISYQIGLAIGEEVLELEKAGIKIIQIDEAALREKLPLRKDDWSKGYLEWAIPAFRLTNSKVKADTSIHTHMCYSEFGDIINAIEDMDADVISIEAARSDFSLLDSLRESNFKLEIGPGIYDIHSPRVPAVKELEELINRILSKIGKDKIWINPDCGLKTRGEKETKQSLINMVQATKLIRKKL
ncbi:MAG: 5-methyltetrahydropteroyltriglutamate--homocysteine S-methyltransferase [Clostridiaceae bacterium]|nr:5-methyltetrahydropteroyltriglutamate--homocysteine S-methyltransferase [Clostridiaceae bacterium]